MGMGDGLNTFGNFHVSINHYEVTCNSCEKRNAYMYAIIMKEIILQLYFQQERKTVDFR